MACDDHVEIVRRGTKSIREWRTKNSAFRLDLSGSNLSNASLDEANLTNSNLRGADLSGARLDLAELYGADLSHARLVGAHLHRAALWGANLTSAKLNGADLTAASLGGVNLTDADLQGADLRLCHLVEANLTRAKLNGCHVYGVSAWKLLLDGTDQTGLIVTPPDEPSLEIDDLEVAQFVYLLLNNKKIRSAIDTITTKVVVVLGRFTPARKIVLDTVRDELRQRNYVPVLFDFAIPEGRDVTETVTLLARMARFVIADLTEPSSIPHELQAIIPDVAVPIQPIIEGGEQPYSMFKDYWKYDWVLPVHRYEGLGGLVYSLAERVIVPAEAKAKELATKKGRPGPNELLR